MITFINDRALAIKLREGVVPSREKFMYFMLISIWTLICMSMTFTDWLYEPATRIHHITDAILIILHIVGITLCYETNKEGDDTDFIERITVLGFPAYVRSVILAVVIVIPPVLAIELLGLAISDDIVFFVANLVVTIYLYYRLSTAIKIVASPAATETV